MKWLNDRSRRCARCDLYMRPEAFAPNPKMADGLHSWCRECAVANTRKWRAANRKTLNKRKRAAYRENRVAINERVRALYAKRRRAINARRRAAYAATRRIAR